MKPGRANAKLPEEPYDPKNELARIIMLTPKKSQIGQELSSLPLGFRRLTRTAL